MAKTKDQPPLLPVLEPALLNQVHNSPSQPAPMQPTGKKPPRPLDPILRLTAQLDRLLAEMHEDERAWALSFLVMKYGLEDGVVIRVTRPE